MRAEAFAEAFAGYCIERGDHPVGQDVLIVLFDRLSAAALYREEGASTVCFSCRYVFDPSDLYENFGPDLYNFDPKPPTPFNLWSM